MCNDFLHLLLRDLNKLAVIGALSQLKCLSQIPTVVHREGARLDEMPPEQAQYAAVLAGSRKQGQPAVEHRIVGAIDGIAFMSGGRQLPRSVQCFLRLVKPIGDQPASIFTHTEPVPPCEQP